MKKILTVLLIMQTSILFAQSDSKIRAAVDTFKNSSMEKGITMMTKITDEESTINNWDLLLQMYYARYKSSRITAADAAVIAVGQSMGIKKAWPPSQVTCFNDLITACRKGDLYSDCPFASMYLREFFVDYAPDTAISKEASDELDQAEGYFGKKDYANAKTYYHNALILQPNYYSATIYLGDSYWYLDKIDSAIYYFNKGIQMHPDLLEPRKYLVDALAEAQRNAEAEKECFNAIYIYPDGSMFMKYRDLLKRENKKFDKHWIKRGSEVNRIRAKEHAKADDKTWTLYQKAKDEIKGYCDSNGVITKSNSLTKAKYLEVYSFEKMLKETKKLPDDLVFAKKMMDEGYLDCYVFISVFHFDLYPQYKDFVKDNKDRISKYITTYLVE